MKAIEKCNTAKLSVFFIVEPIVFFFVENSIDNYSHLVNGYFLISLIGKNNQGIECVLKAHNVRSKIPARRPE
ncbi:hypothetical protein VcTj87_03780 [Vibrio comitans]